MLTALGKVLRVIRIEHGMLLKDMADLIDVKPSYISSIENGKRKPSERFIESIISAMDLTSNEISSIWDAYHETVQEISLYLDSNKPYQMDLGLALARSFETLSPKQATAIKDIILSKGAK